MHQLKFKKKKNQRKQQQQKNQTIQHFLGSTKIQVFAIWHEHTKRQTSAKVIKGNWAGEKEVCCCFKMKKKVWEEKPAF